MTDELFAAAGGLAPAYARVDWPATPLGAPQTWSPALRRSARLVLDTGFPSSLFWGPEFVLVYNEAFVSLIGDKHPSALGSPAREVFAEVWDLIGPMMAGVRAGAGALWVQDSAVPLRRDGAIGEAYFTFSYSPVRNDDGEIEGVMDIATETTREVIGRRRLLLLGRLRRALAEVDELDGFSGRVLSILREDREDLPGIALRGLDAATPGEPAPGSSGESGIVVSLGLTGADADAAMLVEVNRELEADDAYLPFLGLVAAAIGGALERLRLRLREREAANEERMRSETLQRALLTRAPLPDHAARVAVRYLPAAIGAAVGGDWHDAFRSRSGSLTLVIGDVTGHDRDAAAAMGQVRSIVRGIATTLPDPPDRVLAQLEETVVELGIGVLATVVLAQLDLSDVAGAGARRLRWCNAGHPPPVLAAPGAAARLLELAPDPLLGLGTDSSRHSHELVLAPGSTLVLYTDGLVERRGAVLDDGLRWLCELVDAHRGHDPESVADAILGDLDAQLEDDLALLVLTV